MHHLPSVQRATNTFVVILLFPFGSGWQAVSQLSQQADISDKKPSLPLSDPNMSIGLTRTERTPQLRCCQWADVFYLISVLGKQAGRLCSSVTDDCCVVTGRSSSHNREIELSYSEDLLMLVYKPVYYKPYVGFYMLCSTPSSSTKLVMWETWLISCFMFYDLKTGEIKF